MQTRTRRMMMTMAVAALGATAIGAAPEAKHVHLSRSEPMADSTTTTPPTAIRLWFSAAVQVNVTTVRVTDAAGAAVATATPRRETGTNPAIAAEFRDPVANGRYSVAWRTMSRDGHPVSGTFNFAVAAAAPSH